MYSVGCPELIKIKEITSKTVVVPDTFLVHAKTCSQCIVYLSFFLAAGKAIATVERVKFAGCEHDDFKIRLIKLIAEFIKKESWISDPEEKKRFPKILMALYLNPSWCELCQMYFGILCEKTFDYQKEYMTAIMNAQKIFHIAGKLPPERIVQATSMIIPANSRPN